MWKKYEVELRMTGYFAASLPQTREDIEKMLEHRMPAKPPEDYIPISELVDEVAERVGVTTEEGAEEELAKAIAEERYGWSTFPRNGDGLYYEGRCIRGHIKDCANQIRDAIKPEIRALKSKVSNKVYIMTDIIPLMVHGIQVKEISGTAQRFVQVMTRQGPRSTIKFVDYVEKPVLTFHLNVLDDGIITDDILNDIFEYGSIHGMGQERSQGWGRYTFTVRQLS